MPRSAIASGCVDFVLPPEGIAQELSRLGRHPYVITARSGEERADEPRPSPKAKDGLRRDPGPAAREGHGRRLQRLQEADDPSGASPGAWRSSASRRWRSTRAYLEGHADEVQALYQDCLITVTSFFRDPEAFQALSDRVFPLLLKDRRARRAHPRVGARVRHGRGGLFDRHLPAGARRGAEGEPLPPDLRHRPQRERPREGAGGKLSGEHRPGRLAGAPAAVLHQGGRRLPDEQGRPRDVRLRAPRPDQGPALLPHGPHQLPERAHLPGAARCSRGCSPPSTTPSCPRASCCWERPRRRGRSQDLFAPVDEKHRIYSKRPAAIPALFGFGRSPAGERERPGARAPGAERRPARGAAPRSGPDAAGPVRARRRHRRREGQHRRVPRRHRTLPRARARPGEPEPHQDGAQGAPPGAAPGDPGGQEEGRARPQGGPVAPIPGSAPPAEPGWSRSRARRRASAACSCSSSARPRPGAARRSRAAAPAHRRAPTRRRTRGSGRSWTRPRATCRPSCRSTRRPTRSCRPRTRRSFPPTRSCRASTRSWRRPRRSSSRATRSWPRSTRSCRTGTSSSGARSTTRTRSWRRCATRCSSWTRTCGWRGRIRPSTSSSRSRPRRRSGRLLYELGDRQWDIPALRQALDEVLPRGRPLEGFEVEHEFPRIGRRTMVLNARRLRRETGQREHPPGLRGPNRDAEDGQGARGAARAWSSRRASGPSRPTGSRTSSWRPSRTSCAGR